MKDNPVILVVDDEPSSIELIEAYLIPQGYEIVKAKSGEEALGKLSSNQIDLIVLDVRMPGMDGFEFIRRVRQDNTHRLLPIILVTVLRDSEDRVKGIEAGCDDFLSKPVDKMELIARVRSLIKIKAYNDLRSNYLKELESEVTRRTEKLKHALEKQLQEISERKKAEESLCLSEVRRRTLVDAIPDLVWLKDLNGVYHSCNPTFERFFGAKEADIVGKTDYDFKDKDLADFFREHDRKAVEANGLNVNEEWLTFAADGHSGLFETIRTPMRDAEGHLLGVLGISRDITERKQAAEEKAKIEAQLLQAQKMESIGQLAGGVAHDFNNMLSIIIGFTEVAIDTVGPAHPVISNLEEIRKAAYRSSDLTRQLLAFARGQTIAPEVLDLNETIEGMVKMLRCLIGEDIDLIWLPGKSLWQIEIDPSQIDQILANLCVNARDAISGVGKITIETGNDIFNGDYCASHPGFASGEYVMLTVSDNGSGMDKETLDRIFEPFFTTKELGNGTGLGLATVYGIVKQNNGFIKVCSEPGQGTTFTIYLPRYMTKSEKIQKTAPAVTAVQGNETILLVEDEPVILQMTTMMLERHGYTVLAANTPGEAIRMADAHTGVIHLVMTDVVMPEMNGKDLVKNLLLHDPNLKYLFMSGYTANVIAHHGVLDPGVNFIQKPFSIKDLTVKVREVLDDAKNSTQEQQSQHPLESGSGPGATI